MKLKMDISRIHPPESLLYVCIYVCIYVCMYDSVEFSPLITILQSFEETLH